MKKQQEDLPPAAYRREMHKNWLLFERAMPTKLSYEVMVLKKNQIAGLLPLTLRPLDERLTYAYDITSRVDLQTMMANRAFGCEQLRTFFAALLALLGRLSAYLLDGNGLLLAPPFIFMDADGAPAFCYTDFATGDLREKAFALSEYMLDHVDPQDVDALLLACRIRFVLQTEDWAGQMESILAEKDPQTEVYPEAGAGVQPVAAEAEEMKVPDTMQTADLSEATLCYPEVRERWSLRQFFAKVLRPFRKKERAGQLPDERDLPMIEENAMLSFDGVFESAEEYLPFIPDAEEGESGTRLLANLAPDEVTAEAYLIPEGVYDKEAVIHLPRKMLLLGTQEPTVDIRLDSTAVSRLHARIYCEGNDYLLADLNSRNGTFVNGEALSGLAGKKLQEGDRVRFADLSYRFTRHKNGRAA